MTLADFQSIFGSWWPYAAVLLVGFLPTELWRVLAVVLAKGLREESEVLQWVRLVASTLLAAIVVKLVMASSGALGSIPLWGRIAAVPVAVAALFAARRSVIAAVLAGEAVILLAGFLG